MKFLKYYFSNSWWLVGFMVALMAIIHVILGSTREYWMVFGVLCLPIIGSVIGTYFFSDKPNPWE